MLPVLQPYSKLDPGDEKRSNSGAKARIVSEAGTPVNQYDTSNPVLLLYCGHEIGSVPETLPLDSPQDDVGAATTDGFSN